MYILDKMNLGSIFNSLWNSKKYEVSKTIPNNRNNNNSIPISQGKEYILYKQNKINNVNKYSNQDKDIIEGFDGMIGSTRANTQNLTDSTNLQGMEDNFNRTISSYAMSQKNLMEKSQQYLQGKRSYGKNIHTIQAANTDDIIPNWVGCYKSGNDGLIEQTDLGNNTNITDCKVRASDLGYSTFALRQKGTSPGNTCFVGDNIDKAQSNGLATKSVISYSFSKGDGANTGGLMMNGQIGTYLDDVTTNLVTDLTAITNCDISIGGKINPNTIIATYGYNCNGTEQSKFIPPPAQPAAVIPTPTGYTKYTTKDSQGNDIFVMTNGTSLADIAAACDKNTNCAGFNNVGYLKSIIKPQTQWASNSNYGGTTIDLYVKNNNTVVKKNASDNSKDPDKITNLINLANNKCVEKIAGSNDWGIPLFMNDCDPYNSNQVMQYKNDPYNSPSIITPGDLCFTVLNNSLDNDAKIIQYGCSGNNNANWSYGTDKTLRSKHSGKCLTILDQSNDNQAEIGIYDCNGSPYQQWEFKSNAPVPIVKTGSRINTASIWSKPWIPIKDGTWANSISQLNDGTIIVTNGDGGVYTRTNLSKGWTTISEVRTPIYTAGSAMSQWVSSSNPLVCNEPDTGNIDSDYCAVPTVNAQKICNNRSDCIGYITPPTATSSNDWPGGSGAVGTSYSLLLNSQPVPDTFTNVVFNKKGLFIPMKGVIQITNGTYVGIGQDNNVYTSTTLTGNWSAPQVNGIMSIIQINDGTFVGVGLDNTLMKSRYLNSNVAWKKITCPHSCCVSFISTLNDYSIVGIGRYDGFIYTRKSLDSQWILVDRSMPMSSVTQLKDGTILATSQSGDFFRK